MDAEDRATDQGADAPRSPAVGGAGDRGWCCWRRSGSVAGDGAAAARLFWRQERDLRHDRPQLGRRAGGPAGARRSIASRAASTPGTCCEFPASAYLAGAAWGIFGGSLDAWGRAVSAAFSLGAVGLMFLLVRRWHALRGRLRRQHDARPLAGGDIFGQSFMLEASLVFFTLASFWGLDCWLASDRRRWLIAAERLLQFAAAHQNLHAGAGVAPGGARLADIARPRIVRVGNAQPPAMVGSAHPTTRWRRGEQFSVTWRACWRRRRRRLGTRTPGRSRRPDQATIGSRFFTLSDKAPRCIIGRIRCWFRPTFY